MFAVVPFTALAQVQERQNFPAERMRLSVNRDGLIDVEWGRLIPHLQWDATLWLGYAKEPIVLYDVATRQQSSALVRDRLGAAAMFSIGLFNWVELGLELPMTLYQTRDTNNAGVVGGTITALSSLGVGDIRFIPKVRLLRSDLHHIDLALLLGLTVPSGLGRAYLGEPTATFKPEVLVSRAWTGLRLAANLGVDVRGATRVANQIVESEATFRVGAGYRLADHGLIPLEVDASLSGAFSLVRPFANFNQTALEARGMVAYTILRWVQVFAGAGAGLTSGWGTPDWRLFGGVRVGTVGPEPQPASEPASEPASIPASLAVVPVDTDQDGLTDDVDKCPSEPEDKDGFEDDDGCPDSDNDKDGILDANDSCKNEPGSADNRGCPDKDSDNDSVVDRVDNCPNEPGTPANQGCPSKQLVIIKQDRLEITQTVLFETGSDKIKPASFGLLDNVAAVLAAHPEVAKIRIEGHTDDQGDDNQNMTLSRRRAESVRRYVMDKGIADTRLEAWGYGETKPIASNKTPKGRAKNRRVEFIIEGAAR